MPGFEHGFDRAVSTFIIALIFSIVLRGVLEELDLGYIGVLISILIFIISLIAIVEITENMVYWGILYSFGYLIGLLFLLYAMSSLLNPFEIGAYIIITLIAIGMKINNKL